MPDYAEQQAALRRAGVTARPADLDRGHYLGIRAWDVAAATSDAGWRAYAAALAGAAGAGPAVLEAATDALLEVFATSAIWRRRRDDPAAALRALRSAGLAVIVVSNSDGTVEAALRTAAICQVGPGPGVEVAAVLDSSVVGAAKPDPRIFGLALAAAGVAAREALHVGDSVRADVEGARVAGVRPVHFDPYAICRGRDHAHVRSLAGLADLLGRGGPTGSS